MSLKFPELFRDKLRQSNQIDVEQHKYGQLYQHEYRE
jgi:hypothetical protein